MRATKWEKMRNGRKKGVRTNKGMQTIRKGEVTVCKKMREMLVKKERKQYR